MGWKSVLFGFAALVAFCLGSFAQSTSAPLQTRQPYQAPVRIQGSPVVTPGQPRYATMIPPAPEEDVSVSAAPPSAAPTAPVAASPLDRTAQTPSVPQASAAPRYSTMEQPRSIEQVTVTGLRQAQDGLYRLGPGDKLRVTVFNETDLSGEFAVDGQGFVRLPLVGQLPAAGLTTYALESRIADAFVSGGYLVTPRVSVEITGYRPFYIIGEVSKPGEYAYVNAMTAQYAIALAGGYTDRAVESTLWVRHQGESKETEYPADETTRIYPGDVVRVSRSTYWTIMSILSPIISPFSSIAYLLK
jgi:polysaccharide export outer membrane protein